MHQMHLHQLTPPGAKSSSSHIRAYPPTLEASRLRGSDLQLGPQDNQPEGAPAPSIGPEAFESHSLHCTDSSQPPAEGGRNLAHHQARFTGICLGRIMLPLGGFSGTQLVFRHYQSATDCCALSSLVRLVPDFPVDSAESAWACHPMQTHRGDKPGSCGSFESAGTAAGPLSASRCHGLPMQVSLL
jgi:hypothetical protein